MALSNDWRLRIEAWCRALRERLTVPLKALPVRFAATTEHLTVDQARSRLSFKPIRRAGAGGRSGATAGSAAPPR